MIMIIKMTIIIIMIITMMIIIFWKFSPLCLLIYDTTQYLLRIAYYYRSLTKCASLVLRSFFVHYKFLKIEILSLCGNIELATLKLLLKFLLFVQFCPGFSPIYLSDFSALIPLELFAIWINVWFAYMSSIFFSTHFTCNCFRTCPESILGQLACHFLRQLFLSLFY